MRILFILKNQLISGGHTGPGKSSGLFNSAQFVCDMLHNELGHDTKLVIVQDNNSIDREVSKFRPDVAVIEALWVVPEKFKVLHEKHPEVVWVIRNHSAVPFLAHEGIAMDWLLQYSDFPNVLVGCNDLRTQSDLQMLIDTRHVGRRPSVVYLPNYYPTQYTARRHDTQPHQLDIGCFGAIRPLKNQLIQAVGAIEFAEREGKHLRFHINGTRTEGGGEPIRKNLRNLFKLVPHQLVEHGWMSRNEFIRVVRRMDAGLQCSYTETFNIVAADFVMNDVPIVTSPEIEWVAPSLQADPNSASDIARKLGRALRHRRNQRHSSSKDRLIGFSKASVIHWGEALAEIACG